MPSAGSSSSLYLALPLPGRLGLGTPLVRGAAAAPCVPGAGGLSRRRLFRSGLAWFGFGMPTATTGILRMLRDRVAPVWTVVADFFSARFGVLGPSGGGRSPWGLAAAGTPRRSVALRAVELSRGKPGCGARRRRVERHRTACRGQGARRQRGEQRHMAGWGRGAQRTVVVWGRGSASTAAVTCALARCGSYCRIFF